MNVDIEELLRLEDEVEFSCERETLPISLDAKMNMLKFLQVQTVVQFQLAYDDLYKEGGLECLPRQHRPGLVDGHRPTQVLGPTELR